jgi:hypothetical protein
MPRYFFHLHGDGAVRDAMGQELPDDNAARQEAVAVAAELGRNRQSTSKLLLVVTNGKGEMICEQPIVAS